MKFSLVSRLRSGLLLATVSFLLNTVSVCFADQFGTTVATDWQDWAAFSQGAGVNGVVDQQGGTSYVKGNVGVWGNGNITLSSSAILDGDLYYRTGGTLKINGSAKITGMTHHDAAGDTILQNSSNEAYQESLQLAAQPANNPSPAYNFTTINTSQNMTITGTGHVVLNLTDFVLSSSATLTLQGTTPTTTFVFNVSNQFSLTGSARIVLSGITPFNVVYNVLGTGNASVGGTSQLKGILLANRRDVTLSSQSITTGEVVGNKVTISGGAQLIHASQ
jgi:Flp pilus assembly protein TadG